jgi:hypothetical protein
VIVDKSYKIRGGKLVDRTPEERADLDRQKAKFYGNPRETTLPPPRIPRSNEPFVKLTTSQLEQLFRLKSPSSVCIFMVILHENFRHRGKPFIFPAGKLAAQGGFSPRTQRRALLQLEACGLILIRRKNRELPVITIP